MCLYVPNFCHNDELSSTMCWVGCLVTDSDLFILFAENSQILLKISVIPILLTVIYLVALNLLINNHSWTQQIIVAEIRHNTVLIYILCLHNVVRDVLNHRVNDGYLWSSFSTLVAFKRSVHSWIISFFNITGRLWNFPHITGSYHAI